VVAGFRGFLEHLEPPAFKMCYGKI
jgi:hypothetical protein